MDRDVGDECDDDASQQESELPEEPSCNQVLLVLVGSQQFRENLRIDLPKYSASSHETDSHVRMVTQAITTQLTFQFLVAILALTAIRVFVAHSLRANSHAWTIGDHCTPIGSLALHLALHDDAA